MIDGFAFMKMHGLGNCYIYVDALTNRQLMETLNYADVAKQVSNSSTGVGSDGLIVMEPSDRAAVKMRIFNKDGSEGKNCGNGLRCVARYVYDQSHVASERFKIETLSGLVDATIHLDGDKVEAVTIDMGSPRFEPNQIPVKGFSGDRVIAEAIEVGGNNYEMTAVSMGNPHAIFFVEDIKEAPLKMLGPKLADNHPVFPEGVNVGFVERITDEEIAYRVWERGSGITEACGTGAVAAVVAACLNDLTHKDREITVHLPGGDLFITWTSDGSVLMKGSASYICEGRYFLT